MPAAGGDRADKEAGPETIARAEGQEIDNEEDCEPRRIVLDRGMPTLSEIDDRNVDQFPCRS